MFYKFCLFLVIVGGLNWGLMGAFRFDLVAWIAGGSMAFLARIIYGLIGIAAICAVPLLFAPTGQDSSGTRDVAHHTA